MGKHLLENSKIISLLIILFRKIYYFEEQIDKSYKNSRTCRLLDSLYYRIKSYFKYSFTNKLTSMGEGINFAFLDNSRIAQMIVYVYSEWCNNYSKRSAIMIAFREIRKELYLAPAKIAGIIIVIAIVTNVFLAVILKIEISAFGWFMSGFVFLGGLIGIFCNSDWQTLANNSKILRKGL